MSKQCENSLCSDTKDIFYTTYTAFTTAFATASVKKAKWKQYVSFGYDNLNLCFCFALNLFYIAQLIFCHDKKKNKRIPGHL